MALKNVGGQRDRALAVKNVRRQWGRALVIKNVRGQRDRAFMIKNVRRQWGRAFVIKKSWKAKG